MLKLTLALIGVLAASGAMAQAVYHQGYTNRNGTYVQPHYQSAPNNTRMDNWSSQGNVNPYTGSVGTRDPYAPSNRGYGR